MAEKSADDLFSVSSLSLQISPGDEGPVALLIKMAERGEIDPWDVDIIPIIDRFFTEAENQRSFDLRASGRMLFYAATLLRIKAEYFDENIGDGSGDEGDTGEEFFDDESSLGIVRRERRSGDPIPFLEQEISRRLQRKSFRKQPVSVYMLINLLRNAEKEERRRQRESFASFDLFSIADDVLDLAHEETYQDATTHILSCCHKLSEQNESVTLSMLADEFDVLRHQVFVSLLFLAYDGFLSLHQAEFFGEIYVTLSDAMDQESFFDEGSG
jgi:segregation and condensation protein A